MSNLPVYDIPSVAVERFQKWVGMLVADPFPFLFPSHRRLYPTLPSSPLLHPRSRFPLIEVGDRKLSNGVRGGAPAKNAFWRIFKSKKRLLTTDLARYANDKTEGNLTDAMLRSVPDKQEQMPGSRLHGCLTGCVVYVGYSLVDINL